jgi:hypothetical protein
MQSEVGVIQLKRNVSIFYSHVWIFPYGKNHGVIFAIGLQIVATILSMFEQPLEYKLVTCPHPRALPGVKRDLVKEKNFSKAKLLTQKNKFCLLI